MAWSGCQRPKAAGSTDGAACQSWSIELLKRGILVNPNKKFFLSLAHTEADVDRTFEACEAVFPALKR